MNNSFRPISGEEDILNLKENPNNVLISHPMFKVGDLIHLIKCKLLSVSPPSWDNDNYKLVKKWIGEGLDCELLNLGSTSWKKGKVRIKVTLEFCSEEDESPLDDIRKGITENQE